MGSTRFFACLSWLTLAVTRPAFTLTIRLGITQRCLQLVRHTLPEIESIVADTEPSAVVEHGLFTRSGDQVRSQPGLHISLLTVTSTRAPTPSMSSVQASWVDRSCQSGLAADTGLHGAVASRQIGSLPSALLRYRMQCCSCLLLAATIVLAADEPAILNSRQLLPLPVLS